MRLFGTFLVGAVVAAAEYIDELALFPRPTTTTTPAPPETTEEVRSYPADARWQVVSTDPECHVGECGCPEYDVMTKRCVNLFDDRQEAINCAKRSSCDYELLYMRTASFNVCQIGKMYVIPIAPSFGNDDEFWADGYDAFISIPIVNTGKPFKDLKVDIYPPNDSNAVIGMSAGGTSCAVHDDDYNRQEDLTFADVESINATALVVNIQPLLEKTYLGHDHNMLFVRAISDLAAPVMVGGYQGIIGIVKPEPEARETSGVLPQHLYTAASLLFATFIATLAL